MAANRDIANEEIDEVEEEAPRRSNVLRLILLLLLILVGLCVLCYLAGPLLRGLIPIPSIPGIPTIDLTTPIVPIEETPTETPTSGLVEPSPEATTPPAPPTEQPVVTEEPATAEQPLPTEEPATEEPATATPTSELVDEHDGEIPPEGTETPTTIPVPGPTATPTFGPTVAPTDQANCANNQPPVADAGGPYHAMMGKGQAFVIFDGSGSSDADGTITSYEWDFGDGNTDGGQSVTYGYSSTGTFVATLTVTDNCGATAIDQAEVTIVGPTPPSSSTITPTPGNSSNATPAAQQQPGSSQGTIGFCYRVQPGDTLLDIAWYYGVPVADVAAVNGLSPEDFLIVGQGLFIPAQPPQPGPNVYEVQSGNSLASIAFQCGLSTSQLAEANGLEPDQALTPGQIMVIPPWSWN